ncbi:hypothetical protein CU098_000449, partial [Rhizopus stolonifer]
AFLFMSFVLSTIFELIALVVCDKIGLKSIPSGPYALVFSALYQYHRIIPVTYKFRIFGLVMTNKLFLYVLAFQLAFSRSTQTLVPSLCGCLAGALYRTDVGNIKQWRFPGFLQSVAHQFVKKFLISSPNPRSSATLPVQRPIITSLSSVNSILTSGLANENDSTTTNTNRRTTRSSMTSDRSSSMREYLDTITSRDVAESNMDPISQEYTRILMTMFPDHPQETITRALSSAHNELNRAVEIMLNTPSPTGESSSHAT